MDCRIGAIWRLAQRPSRFQYCFNVTFDLFAASENSFSPFGANGRRLVFDGPVKADVVFRYDVPVSDTRAVEIYGKVENVFDNNYYELGFGAPGAWAIGGLRFKF